MMSSELDLIGERTSPLFRILWTQDPDEPSRRQFDNNIVAFHIGNGFILTVAHNLRSEAPLIKSLPETVYQSELRPRLPELQRQVFEQLHPLDPSNGRRYPRLTSPNDARNIGEFLRQNNIDTRWITLMRQEVCRPQLILQFRDPGFFGDAALAEQFGPTRRFHEPAINRHTFLVDLELTEAFFREDIALYRMTGLPQALIDRIPFVEPEYELLEAFPSDLYCLQSSPNSEVGRLLNRAVVEGYLEHFGMFPDRVGGHYTLEGMRYLIKGYFRFGSSGAPYIRRNAQGRFVVNAIQSEASPIQLSIGNAREGNYQYVNAIASPLSGIRDRLSAHLSGAV
jgi:hypothetical protein